jgi:hypothetical protein
MNSAQQDEVLRLIDTFDRKGWIIARALTLSGNDMAFLTDH